MGEREGRGAKTGRQPQWQGRMSGGSGAHNSNNSKLKGPSAHLTTACRSCSVRARPSSPVRKLLLSSANCAAERSAAALSSSSKCACIWRSASDRRLTSASSAFSRRATASASAWWRDASATRRCWRSCSRSV